MVNSIRIITADVAEMALIDAKSVPCSRAIKMTIGPATTGNPARRPANPDPHFLPANDIREIKNGTIVNLSISIFEALINYFWI